jgi:hypothetical protein
MLSSWYVAQLLTFAAAKTEVLVQMADQKMSSSCNSGSSNADADVDMLDVSFFDLLRLLQQRQQQQDAAATAWLANLQQQQQRGVLQELLLLPQYQITQQQQQQLLASFSCRLAGRQAAAGVLHLTNSCMAFTTLFGSSSSSSSSSGGGNGSSCQTCCDVTKILPLQSLLQVALVPAAAAAAAAAAAEGPRAQASRSALGHAAGTGSAGSSFCSLDEESSDAEGEDSSASNDIASSATASAAAAAAAAATKADGTTAGGWLQMLSQSIKQWRAPAAATSSAAAAAAADAANADRLALQLAVLVEPGVQETVQFEQFGSGQLQQLLLLLRQASDGTGWQVEGSIAAATASLGRAAAPAAAKGSVTLPGTVLHNKQHHQQQTAGESPVLRCVPCWLHGVLCNTPGQLLLFEDRLVFAAAEGAVHRSTQQQQHAGASSSSSSSNMLAVVPYVTVKQVAVHQGWGGSWLAIAAGNRQQLLLGGLQGCTAQKLQTEVLQQVAKLQSSK